LKEGREMEIKVLGGGCARCKKLHDDAQKAVEQAGLGLTVEYVGDITEILKYDVLMTPALVIDGQVKAAGRVPALSEMVAWINEAAREG
jgi:small redox-active disulfide protein 2